MVTFDLAVDPYVSGRNTGTLTVVGLPFTLDLRGSTAAAFNLDAGNEGGGSTCAPVTFHLLPGGNYSVEVPASAQPPVVALTLSTAGTPDYVCDPMLDSCTESCVSGRGTNLVTITCGPRTQCGNGVIEACEQCDDGNVASGDCCSPTCQFDASGVACTDDGNVCTDDECDALGACGHTNNTAPCNDGIACTTVDQCAGGSCVGNLPPQCDDENPCTIDSCDDETGCVNAQEPTDGCLVAERGQLVVKDNADNRKDKLIWKWKRGAATTLDDLGDPAVSTTYTLCVYDKAAGQSSLATGLAIPASGFWTHAGKKGWKYKDKSASSDGVRNAKLRSGANLKSKAGVKAKGVNVPTPVPVGGGMYFSKDDAVTVQLLSTEGMCWTGEFPTAKKNTEKLFKAKYK